MIAAQKRYEQHHNAKVEKQTPFRVGHLVYVGHPQLWTSTMDTTAVEAYSILLAQAFEPC